MMSKFTYYDVISNLLPGLVLIWALPILGPLGSSIIPIILTGNTIIDPILLIAICYVIGHVIQFFSKYSIEPLLKKMYWKREFYSDIFLISSFKQCSQIELSRYISCIEKKLGFSKDDLAILFDEGVSSDRIKKQKAIELSRVIYRTIDAKTADSSIAQKAHLQNAFYALFRNLAGVFLILTILDLVAIIELKMGFIATTSVNIYMFIINLVLIIIFFIRTKQRGELYIRGLFWSICQNKDS